MLNQIADIKNAHFIASVAKKYGFKRISNIDLSSFARENRTFFILGSGSTINDLTENQWKEIDSGFSVGMNKWLIHDFIPNATSLEKNWYPELYEKLYNDPRLINSKHAFLFYPGGNIEEYSGFPFNVSNEIKSRIYLHGGSRNTFLNSRKALDIFHNQKDYVKIVSRKLKNGLNYEQKGSVYRLTQFAIGSGFKKIVYCGIDLNNTKYFWDDVDFHSKRGIEKLEIVEQKNNTVHQTDIASERSIPISSVLESLNQGLAKHGIILSVASNKSKLAEFLPVWNG